MTQTVVILGRQPALGKAELESLFGADALHSLAPNTVVVDAEPTDFPMSRLGGAIKAAKLLTYLPYTDWNQIEQYLARELPKHVCCLPPGKIRLGLSTYGLKVSPKRLSASGLSLKKTIKEAGRSGRVVPNVTNELNTAQVLHNQLTGPTGYELLLIANGKQTALAQTFAVQDIDAYAARDQKRPKRDARVGMLPPKLAQIIVNLAIAQTPPPLSQQFQETYDRVWDIYDPFCGTGVVLQEALLMGYSALGSDREPRMVDYTHQNLAWLADKTHLEDPVFHTNAADATEALFWDSGAIACETYLGRPFSAPPEAKVLAEVVKDVDTIHKKFLKNVARQTKPGFRMCIAVPAWRTKSGFKHLPTLENLSQLGYTRVSFAHVGNEDLVYHRPEQVVARELVVLERR